jgi:2-pyrone-4,6-dicarboxylate lactonase
VTETAADAGEHLSPPPSDGNPEPHPNPRPPVLRLPPGSCDAHCHVFGPATVFPYAPDRTFTPFEVPRDVVAERQRFLGFERSVIVQSSCYGSDHRALLDALRADPANLRGVALLNSGVSSAELDVLDEAGVRGARLHFLPHLGAAPDLHEQNVVLQRIGERGWHAEIHVQGPGVAEHQRMIESIETKVVIDHMARVDLREGLEGSAVRSLRELLDCGHVWVKLSGVDRVSLTGPPYDGAVALAALLARHAPERVLWGTDFPHPNIVGPAPDDGLLVDLIAIIAPTESARRKLLVDNPVEFFGFDPV